MTRGFCQPCTKADSEYYIDSDDVEPCTATACDNILCAAGHFRTGRCGDDITRSNNDYTCVPCAKGSYNPLDQTEAEECELCDAGSYQDETGTTVCKPCTPGYYCAEGAAAALPCPGGTHKNVSLAVMTSVDQCIICPVGTYCPVGSAEAAPCAPGTNSSLEGAKTCGKCPAGTYQDIEGQEACKPCTPGYYCAEGAAAALPCPAGTRKDESLAIMTSVEQCITCSAGASMPRFPSARLLC